MTYPPKLKAEAVRLHKEEGRSAEWIAERFSKEQPPEDRPSPRTIRKWIENTEKDEKSINEKFNITDEKRLEEHHFELEKTGEKLAENLLTMLNHKDNIGKDRSETLIMNGRRTFTYYRIRGNIVDGGGLDYLTMDEHGVEKRELPFMIEDSIFKPVDRFIAKCLLEHLKYRYPDRIQYEDWLEITPQNITQGIIDTISLLCYSKHFGICPTCQVCKTVKTYKESP